MHVLPYILRRKVAVCRVFPTTDMPYFISASDWESQGQVLNWLVTTQWNTSMNELFKASSCHNTNTMNPWTMMRKKDSMHYVSEYKLQLHCRCVMSQLSTGLLLPLLWLIVVAGNSSCMHACRVDGPGLESSRRGGGAPIHGTLRLWRRCTFATWADDLQLCSAQHISMEYWHLLLGCSNNMMTVDWPTDSDYDFLSCTHQLLLMSLLTLDSFDSRGK